MQMEVEYKVVACFILKVGLICQSDKLVKRSMECFSSLGAQSMSFLFRSLAARAAQETRGLGYL